jgi:hypothetical protein
MVDTALPRATIRMVYNANGGIVAGAMDVLHKAFSPATYACALCAVSYDLFGMKPAWRKFVGTLPYPVIFHHRDDFATAFPGHGIALPAVLLETAGEFRPLIDRDAFARIDTLEALITAMREAMPAVAPN